MQILGMETAVVGKKPSALTISCLKEINGVFRKTVEYLEKEKPSVEFAANFWMSSDDGRNYDNEIFANGYFTLSKIYNWLAYHQLLTVIKTKEPNPHEKGKMRTVWFVKLNQLGKEAYKNGAFLIVDAAWGKDIKVGLGRDYTHYDELWKRVESQADGVVAKSRWERWYGEFRDYWMEKLTATKTKEAYELTDAWASSKIEGSPKLKRQKKDGAKVKPSLDKGQKSMMGFLAALNKK